MENFKESLLKNKLVSVWGTGYLGYTKIVKLQAMGFKANAFDVTNSSFEENLMTNGYPNKEQIYSWSSSWNIPSIDISRINIHKKFDSMFNTNVHILAFSTSNIDGKSFLKQIAATFVKFKDRLRDVLIVFQSAGIPGLIEKDFIKVMEDNGVNSSFASAFRSDWTIEEFLSNNKKRVLAAKDKTSLKKAMFFYDTLGIKYKTLSSIKEAEIYENAKNSFQYTTEVFINQLAVAYPDTNVRAITQYLLEDIELNESHLSIGAGGYKILHSIQNTLDGSPNPDALSLIKEAQKSNVSLILSSAELIKKKGYKSVTIMGLSIKGNQKNIDLSPSVILAEYLNQLDVKVYVDDPFYDEKSLSMLLPFAKRTDILKDKLKSDVVFIMTDHNKYRYMTQDDIDSSGFNDAKLIIDNVSLFREFRFLQRTNYHLVGSGTLELF